MPRKNVDVGPDVVDKQPLAATAGFDIHRETAVLCLEGEINSVVAEGAFRGVDG